MKYRVCTNTDMGLVKEKNEDSSYGCVINTEKGMMAFAIVCDGLGGLSEGELASSAVICSFKNWIYHRLKILCKEPITFDVIQKEWGRLLQLQNEKIQSYGRKKGIVLGTTVMAVLVTNSYYYVVHIGDCRLYEIESHIFLRTIDQTIVEKEVLEGKITRKEAEKRKDRHILWQCCGSNERLAPEFICEKTKKGMTLLLCSDGFWHNLTLKELYQAFSTSVCETEKQMELQSRKLIELGKKRGEKDNLSVAIIKTY